MDRELFDKVVSWYNHFNPKKIDMYWVAIQMRSEGKTLRETGKAINRSGHRVWLIEQKVNRALKFYERTYKEKARMNHEKT